MPSALTLPLSRLSELFTLLLPRLEGGYVLLLQGEIGSGKTSLVRALLAYSENLARPHSALDSLQATESSLVSSPTFSLAQSYESAYFGSIHHYDLYRKSNQEMLELGLLDMLSESGLHCVEWADENLRALLLASGFRTLSIHITQDNATSRTYRIAYE